MSEKDGGPACSRCKHYGGIRQGHSLYCDVHYRFGSMRTRAKRDGKAVPTWEELEAMVPAGMVCIGCGRQMLWRAKRDGSKAGASRLITLQHDRSGALRLICLGCNTRHAAHPGDEFYDIPPEHKRCPACQTVKPFAAFVKDSSRPIGLKSSCKECSRGQHKAWVARNRERVNADQRARRAARC